MAEHKSEQKKGGDMTEIAHSHFGHCYQHKEMCRPTATATNNMQSLHISCKVH